MNSLVKYSASLLYMDLQTFASAATPLNSSTDGSLSVTMKTWYERTLLERLLPNLVHAQFGQKKKIPKNNGKTVEFRRFSPLPMGNFTLTEGITPVGQSLAMTNITATVIQHGNFIVVTDVLTLVSYDEVLDNAATLLGEQAGEYMDTLVRDVLVAGTNVYYAKLMKYNADAELVTDVAGAVIASRNGITNLHTIGVDTLRYAKRIMQKNRVKPYRGEKAYTGKGEYVVIMHGDGLYDIQGNKKWLDVATYATGDSSTFTGEVGKIYGIRIVVSDLAKTWAGTGAASGGAEAYDVYGALMIGADAFGVIDIAGSGNVEYIFQPKGSAGTEDPLKQRATSGWKVMFTTKILQDYAILRIEHGFSGDAKAAGMTA